jgi:hypothetical protein
VDCDGNDIENVALLQTVDLRVDSLTVGDKLTVNASKDIIKDTKEQQQNPSVTGSGAVRALDLNILNGNTAYITLATVPGLTDIEVTYSNFDDGDEMTLLITMNSATAIDFNFPSSNNDMRGGANREYTLAPGTGVEYLVVIKKINGKTYTIVDV